MENEYGKFVFIDTAGIRRKARVDDDIEKYSVLRAYMAVDRADVCVIVIDATEGFTEQDSKVAGYAHEQGKACIVVVNKWDAVEKDGKTMEEYRKKLENDFSFMSYAPFIFISALTGQRVDKLFELINYVCEQNALRISTGMLNDMLAYATARVQPPSDKGKRLQILLYDPGFHQAADLCDLLQQQGSVPLLLPAVSGKPDPGDLRSGRYPDPHHSPGAGQGQQVMQAVRKEG